MKNDDLLSAYFAERLMKQQPHLVEMIRLSLEGGMTVEQIGEAAKRAGNVPLHLAIVYTAKKILKEVVK